MQADRCNWWDRISDSVIYGVSFAKIHACRAEALGLAVRATGRGRWGISFARVGVRCRTPVRGFKSGDEAVATGTVKWFNPTKGYGFIQPTGGGKDVFVHISAVERAGLSTLNEGATVEYEVVANRGKESAENLKVK